jgi:hypothetical protein
MRVSSTPRTAVLSRPSRLLDRRLPLHRGQSFDPAPSSHPAGLRFTRHQRSFTRSPVRSSPRPRSPGWNGPPLRLSPSFAPRRPGAKRRTSRWGQAIEHGPGTPRSTSHRLDPPSVVHSQRATSRRTTSRERASRASLDDRTPDKGGAPRLARLIPSRPRRRPSPIQCALAHPRGIAGGRRPGARPVTVAALALSAA